MNVSHRRVRDDPMTRLAQAVAEIHILAGRQILVKAADAVEDLLLDCQVPAAQPEDLFATDEPAAHCIVLPLYPVRRRFGQARSSSGADIIGRQDIDRGSNPAAIDFMIRVHECEDVTPRLSCGAGCAARQRTVLRSSGPWPRPRCRPGRIRRSTRCRRRVFRQGHAGNHWPSPSPGIVAVALASFLTGMTKETRGGIAELD